MANFGLYSVNYTATLPVNGTSWERTTLMHNGVKVGITTDETDGFGARVMGDSLIVNGEVIAKSASQSAAVSADGKFGEVDLLGHHKCINITLADYNTLLNGGTVAGYKAHDPDAVYNIVDNVATAADVYCDNPIDLSDPLYNNQPECSLPAHQLTASTFTNMTAPHISVHGYKFVITPGERLEVTYMVDTRTGDFTNRLTRGETFTTTIRDANGNVLYDNTTYAGVFKVKLSPFRHNNVNTTGQTWFSVETVDSRGVGSIVLYNDIFIKASATEKLYQMQESDLTRFDEHITPNEAGNNTLAGYKNKVAFTKLFAAVKADANNYTGIKLYNPTGDYIYYIDYHKNHSSTTGQYDFGSQTYYVYHIVSHDIVSEDTQTITHGGTITIGEDEYTVDKAPFEWVKSDGAHLHRIGGTGSNKDKIRVRWKDDVYGSLDPATQQYVGTSLVANGEQGNSLNVFNTISGNTKSIQALKGELADGYYYVVVDSRGSDTEGDAMSIPNDFTLDMNGVTFQGVKCVDLNKFYLISLNNNVDTHVRNGVLSGIFDTSDIQMFIDNRLALGAWTLNSSMEGGYNIFTEDANFCTFDNVESRYALGYDATTQTSSASAGSTITTPAFDTLGYINDQGNVVNPGALADLDATLNADIGSGGHINMVHTSGYASLSSVGSSQCITVDHANYELNSGKQHELFLSFYKEVTENGVTRKVFLETIKTALYNAVKIPSGATHARVSGYGCTDNNGTLVTDSTWINSGNKIPFETPRFSKQTPSRCIVFSNCYWHECRTSAIHPRFVRGYLLDNCRFHKIANIQRDGCSWAITHILGDVEEEWPWQYNIIIRNCTATRDAGDYASRAIGINGMQSFTFTGNNGFSYSEGAMQSGYIRDNIFCGLKITRYYKFEHPCIFYRGNVIDETGFRPFDTVITDLTKVSKVKHNSATVDYPLRWNRCDDPVCTDVAMRDTQAYVPDSLIGSLTYKYHRTKLNNTTYK